jgi:hypothetical protein
MLGRAKCEQAEDAGSVHTWSGMDATEDDGMRRIAAGPSGLYFRPGAL